MGFRLSHLEQIIILLNLNAKRFHTVFLCFGSEIAQSDLGHYLMLIDTLIGRPSDRISDPRAILKQG